MIAKSNHYTSSAWIETYGDTKGAMAHGSLNKSLSKKINNCPLNKEFAQRIRQLNMSFDLWIKFSYKIGCSLKLQLYSIK